MGGEGARRWKMFEKYRKKPVVVSSIQWLGDYDEISLIKSKIIPMGVRIKIDTLEGYMICDIGDWIIIGVNGEVYPCKDDIFKKTYEKV